MLCKENYSKVSPKHAKYLFYLFRIIADRDVWSAPGSYSEAHYLALGKYEKGHEGEHSATNDDNYHHTRQLFHSVAFFTSQCLYSGAAETIHVVFLL